MIIVASANGLVGMRAAWEILERGGSALDAVEVAARAVEDDPSDHSVGYGGYPNLLGEVELDASIMDGTTRRAGAVAALRGYRHAITVARRVMEELPHVMLVGEGAARFAAELGMEKENLLTKETTRAWHEGLQGRLPEAWLKAAGGVLERILARAGAPPYTPEKLGGTVNVLAQDRAGRLASAVSTSGWAWKYPGRVGDSPLIGAGNYADGRYGAAACTGYGELAMRAATAHSVVLALQAHRSLEDACTAALHDLSALDVEASALTLSLVALDRHGNHCAVTTSAESFYVYQVDGMQEPIKVRRRTVPLR